MLLTEESIRYIEDKTSGSCKAAGQKIPYLPQNRWSCSVFTKACHLDIVLSQINPVPIFKHYFLKLHFNIILPTTSLSQMDSILPFSFPLNILFIFLSLARVIFILIKQFFNNKKVEQLYSREETSERYYCWWWSNFYDPYLLCYVRKVAIAKML
jgi:hypothetical protein